MDIDVASPTPEDIVEASREAFAKAMMKENDPAAAATAMLAGARTLWKIEQRGVSGGKKGGKSLYILKKRVEMLALALNAMSRIQGGAWRMLVPVQLSLEGGGGGGGGGVEFMDEEAVEAELQRATEEWKMNVQAAR